MKRHVGLLAGLLMVVLLLGACSSGGSEPITIDYEDAATFEAALNAGEDLTGKVVRFKVSELVPNSSFGYNLQAGDHLNFCSTSNPGVKAGDTITVKVTDIQSMLGSYVIKYEKK